MKTNWLKKLGCLCLTMLLSLCLLAQAGIALADDKTVTSVEVETMPNKTVYTIGEEFSAEGGTLKVTYSDGTTEIVSMTDDSVKLSKPTMNTASTKNVTATIGKKRAVFKIEVVAGMCVVTFDMNYDGAEAQTQEVAKGATAAAPETPVRDGYEFVNWYADADYTHLYDFESSVTGDTTVYAFWKKKDADYVTVTFDYDYYGVLLNKYSYPVEVGTQVKQPSVNPEREGYAFDKWVDENGNAFDFTQAISADTTIKAAWNKTVSGVNTYVFEAEDTNLTGKIGPSYSGSAQEESMIIYNDAINASGNRLVGYLYASGITLEFYIASDVDVDDATIALSITGEYVTMSYDSNDFQVLVNDEAKSFARVTIEATQEAVAQCEDRIVIQNVSLKQGANLIQLKTNNNNAVEGTTFKANAPMVDCLKVTTSAVLIWDENFGEPATGNYQK